jgi:hypothetical protein
VRGAEPLEGGQLENPLDLAFEHHRQHDDAARRRAAELGRDPHVVGRRVRDVDLALLDRALAEQSFSEPQAPIAGVAAVGVARQQAERRVRIVRLVEDVEHGLVRPHHRHQLRKNQPAHRHQVALPLQHAAELGEVRLEPVLLGVLLGGFAQVPDHLVDVVLERRHLALRVERD